MALLEIKNLTVEFDTAAGKLRAVDGVSLSVDKGEVLAIVGESGSGKSVSMLAVMGLLPWTATVAADYIRFEGRDILNISPAERRRIIGNDISMIFQEPIASLNPCFTVGFQIEDTLRRHTNLDRAARRRRSEERRGVQTCALPISPAVDGDGGGRLHPLRGAGHSQHLARRAAADHRQRHLDDLPGADRQPQSLLHRRLPDRGNAAPAHQSRPGGAAP